MKKSRKSKKVRRQGRAAHPMDTNSQEYKRAAASIVREAEKFERACRELAATCNGC